MSRTSQRDIKVNITYTEGWKERFTELTVKYYIEAIEKNNKGGN